MSTKNQDNFIQEYLYVEDYIPIQIKNEKFSDETSRIIELDIFGNSDEEKNDIYIC